MFRWTVALLPVARAFSSVEPVPTPGPVAPIYPTFLWGNHRSAPNAANCTSEAMFTAERKVGAYLCPYPIEPYLFEHTANELTALEPCAMGIEGLVFSSADYDEVGSDERDQVIWCLKYSKAHALAPIIQEFASDYKHHAIFDLPSAQRGSFAAAVCANVTAGGAAQSGSVVFECVGECGEFIC
mmetsp:Transcript_60258/g.138271  ORF Transcript_60258/g.138271 Transcript_60258/m.138271 type:complete len:184 (-) Transcript_60258:311-862(-)